MDSPRSDLFNIVACVRESARRGDWNTAVELTGKLPRQNLQLDPSTLGDYLHALQEALAVAKTSRAQAAASLARLNAAAKFNHARLD